MACDLIRDRSSRALLSGEANILIFRSILDYFGILKPPQMVGKSLPDRLASDQPGRSAAPALTPNCSG
jgi:hypothetical protein